MLLPLHGVGSRQDLPLPLELVALGAGITLAITFILVLRSWGDPKWSEFRGRSLPGLTRLVDNPILRWVLRLLVLGVLAVAILALVAGKDKISNPFPGFLFVWVWVGLVPVSLLAGHLWRTLNPVRTLLAWRGALRRDAEEPLPIGLYPAALGLLAFAWLELVQPDRATTHVLKWWALAFAVAMLGGALVAGARWISSAEPFETFASTVARMSPWQRREGVLHLVNPLRHVSSAAPRRGLWAVCCVLLGSTAFDSLSNGPWWIRTTQSSAVPSWLTGTLGLAVCIAVVTLTFWWGVRAVEKAASPTEPLMDSLARSLIPIVAGYALAHYATLLILEGQRVAINLSDPLVRGDNWFGTAEMGVNGAIFDYTTAVAWGQVLLIVGAHVVGVLSAHDIAVRYLPRDRWRSAQLPLLAVMVLYTCGGLFLLFA